MNGKDNTPSAAFPLGERTAKFLANDGHSLRWVFALGALFVLPLLAALMISPRNQLPIDCDLYTSPAYMNCVREPNRVLYPVDVSYRDRGRAYLKMGRYDQAVVDLNEALRRDSADHESRFNRAEALFKIGKVDLADKDYETLATSSPYALEAYSKRAAMFDEIGDSARAIIAATEAITLSPTADKLHLQRALIYLHGKQYDLAISDVEPILELHPNYFEALWLKGVILLDAGRYLEAISGFNMAISEAPAGQSYPDLWHGRALAVLSSEPSITSDTLSAVFQDMAVASQQAKASPEWQNQICYDLALFDHAEEALQYCNLGLSLAPKEHQILDSRAYVYARLGRWAEALSDWDRAIELSPNDPMYLYACAFTNEQLNNMQAAAAGYAAAREIDKDIDGRMKSLGIVPGTARIPSGRTIWR